MMMRLRMRMKILQTMMLRKVMLRMIRWRLMMLQG